MSPTTPTAASHPQVPRGMWSTVAPYVVPPFAASVAIVLVFHDMIAKSAQQRGQPVSDRPFMHSVREGVRVAPTVGGIVGTQMGMQSLVEKALTGQSKEGGLSSALMSSAIVGTASAPILAIFNGQTMGWTARESLRRFSGKQGLAIAVQETAFVGGLSVADRLSAVMRRQFGNNKVVDYIAAFFAGVMGSFAGHPANTALTRWQSGMTVDITRQLMWGSFRKARAVGVFSVIYKLVKDLGIS